MSGTCKDCAMWFESTNECTMPTPRLTRPEPVEHPVVVVKKGSDEAPRFYTPPDFGCTEFQALRGVCMTDEEFDFQPWTEQTGDEVRENILQVRRYMKDRYDLELTYENFVEILRRETGYVADSVVEICRDS